MAKKGTHYRDISNEFKIALINYSIFERGGQLMRQKEFDPSSDPTLINNVLSGRFKGDALRKRILKFTQKWYWNFNKKTQEADE